MTNTRYSIVLVDGRWVIVNSHDPNLIWCGSHWYPRDEEGPPLTAFIDYVTGSYER